MILDRWDSSRYVPDVKQTEITVSDYRALLNGETVGDISIEDGPFAVIPDPDYNVDRTDILEMLAEMTVERHGEHIGQEGLPGGGSKPGFTHVAGSVSDGVPIKGTYRSPIPLGYDEASERSVVRRPELFRLTTGDWLDAQNVERSSDGLYRFFYALPDVAPLPDFLRPGEAMHLGARRARNSMVTESKLDKGQIDVYDLWLRPGQIIPGATAHLSELIASRSLPSPVTRAIERVMASVRALF